MQLDPIPVSPMPEIRALDPSSLFEHTRWMRRLALRLVHDENGADDLVQECLARAMGRLHAWQPTGTMRSWLFTILHNLHVNELRKDGHAPDPQADTDGVERE